VFEVHTPELLFSVRSGKTLFPSISPLVLIAFFLPCFSVSPFLPGRAKFHQEQFFRL